MVGQWNGPFLSPLEGVKHYDPPHLARCVWIPGSGDRVGPRQNPKEMWLYLEVSIK